MGENARRSRWAKRGCAPRPGCYVRQRLLARCQVTFRWLVNAGLCGPSPPAPETVCVLEVRTKARFCRPSVFWAGNVRVAGPITACVHVRPFAPSTGRSDDASRKEIGTKTQATILWGIAGMPRRFFPPSLPPVNRKSRQKKKRTFLGPENSRGRRTVGVGPANAGVGEKVSNLQDSPRWLPSRISRFLWKGRMHALHCLRSLFAGFFFRPSRWGRACLVVNNRGSAGGTEHHNALLLYRG